MTRSRWTATATLEIPFHDVDLLGIVWHGHYAKYFEAARNVLFDLIGYNYREMEASGYAWPVIEMTVRYAQPLQYKQTIEVEAAIVEYEDRLKINYLVRDAASGRRLTRGHTVQVAIVLPSREMCFVSPPVLFEKLGVTPP
jgi:acyl-CoA thioester hydrolase